MMESLSLRPSNCVPCGASGRSKLLQRDEGQTVPAGSILEIKTRVAHKPISIQEVLPRLWVSQTPNLVRAYHKNGVFTAPKVERVVTEIKEWEESHGEDLRRLSSLFKKLIGIVKGNGGTAILRYDTKNDRLELWTAAKGKMLPDDLYSKLDHHNTEGVTCKKAPVGSGPSKTMLKIGNTLYNIGLSMIPYLASFVRFERNRQPEGSEFTHSDIPLFDTALQGLESGYRFCFRSLPLDLA
ncbi:geranylgeranyl pyrophosphate synthetase [Aspergillus udagawae]|nr:geranylgeranyl pyrophosphate synthetase [Aspergillus udagawae]